ncbi:sugar phosphate nucleotidyltransferase [Siphonobacter sp. SORGH_AS_1065]|uniref:sugar phosphate nucleotidyltransferase n=1 Tax=Siphonobacter sp. SORGH_AS_1065 TaxID=3041795 RepID=UPI0027806D65|nr:sugar phosphate nucleotidyltransferase [Siphonobacter sp. SORGH_AS_1065]MDQ1086426.1 NDP-sugar pyrophosphorylase family protein [Siphonobacter sp. SORGH_AS_1065]
MQTPLQSYPVHFMIMAGGKGSRLSPLTDSIPKALLKINQVPIIERIVNHFQTFGIQDFIISVGHLGQQIKEHFAQTNTSIEFISEQQPLGSIGALRLIQNWKHKYVFIINCDLLTDFDVHAFLQEFLDSGAELGIGTYQHQVKLPWGVIEKDINRQFIGITEKPSLTFEINAGIYVIERSLLTLIPESGPYEGWQFIATAAQAGHKISCIPIQGEWLDIGNFSDYEKAQQTFVTTRTITF